MLRFMFFLVILLYLLSVLFPQLDIGVVLSVLSLIIVLCTLFQAKRFVQILGSTFLILGLILLWTSGARWQEYILSFGPMLDLLTMFTLVPILGIPIKLGGYSGGIQTMIQKRVKTSGQLYMITSGFSYFFSIFMNLATLPMTYYSIRPSLDVIPVQSKERFMSRAITRGFAMPLLWAPVTPIVGIVITMTGVSWVSILPYVIPLSIVGMGMDWYLGARKSKVMIKTQKDLSVHETAAALVPRQIDRSRRVFQILLAIVLFNLVISLVEKKFNYPFLTLVSLMVIPFSFTWSLCLKQGKEFGAHLLKHFQSFSVGMKDQFFIYLSAGFFISTINVSHTNEWLDRLVIQFIHVAGVEIFLILLPLIPLGFAFLGLHPAVSLALMTEGLNPAVIGISPHILTVAMLAGAVSSFLVGPYNATLGLMSNIVKESSYKVSNWNLSFAGLYIGCVMVYLFVLQLFFS
ncbi:hypothetical protein PH210_09140 [Paenibacillus sp. BSR1-1]|uniref:hypothetical protein n=1 Tax=Paenibacillus sp. BSR1-1 TaxID=3020845 RepID=UPI0025B014D3|nr:hypothetical protein [Paenibacillus sp. BSR1-1]MDN3016364.1 hypothetical protein [Paenibacillus sp. BSR1-1]